MSDTVFAFLPFVILVLLAVWGGRITKQSAFKIPAEPYWPFAENPGLAMELADTNQFVECVLGKPGSKPGDGNRKVTALLQKLDFVLIPLYTLFLAVVALQRAGWPRAWPVIATAILTAVFDVIEDLQILSMVSDPPHGSARRFGQLKWIFYFATIGAEGSLLFFTEHTSIARSVGGFIFGAFLILVGLSGIVSAARASFEGITTATKLSALGLVGLAIAPILALYPFSFAIAGEYALLTRIPLVIGALLFALPFLVFFTGARSLLRGLFDLTPPSLFVVTLTSLGVAGMVCMNSYIVLSDGWLRFGLGYQQIPSLPEPCVWLLVMMGLSAPVIISAVLFSARQGRGTGRLIIAAVGGVAVAIGLAWFLIARFPDLTAAFLSSRMAFRLEHWLSNAGVFAGYVWLDGKLDGKHDPLGDHLMALTAFALTLLLYVIVGLYGRSQLGKRRTVPALCAALMLMLMVGWMLAATAFFFDAWRIPTLLIFAAIGILTAQSPRSDHHYHLRPRDSATKAPDPVTTITANGTQRVIVVAANGGGIQASGWAAQVLYGLREDCGEGFKQSLRMISSVSGGSVGTAFFVHWLAETKDARRPDEAAAMSSLDEVAWGFSWPDFLRALTPWVFGGLIGRGRALEEAWCLNSASDAAGRGKMDEPLSNWNDKVTTGELPAVVMNATIAETGERLFLATTSIREIVGSAGMDATDLHTINGEHLDVGVVTAARLSASFPYVTPAARSDASGPQPHAVDGGYYDDYGMATLVEWLDLALKGASGRIKDVLVIQIHGAPVNPDARAKRHSKARGWFYQALAPLTALAAVRTAGQIAHNNVELELLQRTWAQRGVTIDSVTFEFPCPNAPLSWHLVRDEQKRIRAAWAENAKVKENRQRVREFLHT